MKYIVITILTGLAACYSRNPRDSSLQGTPLPSFTLILPDSSTYFNTNSIPEGKPVALFFFGPHCPYSRAQMEKIVLDMQSLKHIRFYVFTNWPFGEMKAFYNFYQLGKYQNIIAGFDYANFFQNYYKPKGIPYLVMYDKNKIIKKVFEGMASVKQIRTAAEQ